MWIAFDARVATDSASFSLLKQRFGVLVMAFAVCLVAISVVGDLFESLIKRAVGAKTRAACCPGTVVCSIASTPCCRCCRARRSPLCDPAALTDNRAMAKRQRLCILGATGSVGMSTLEVVALHPQHFEVFALTARHRIDELAALCERWRPRLAVVANLQQARDLRERLGRADVHTEVLHGAAALSELAAPATQPTGEAASIPLDARP